MTDKPLPRSLPGRPKHEEPGSSVSTWLRASDHDRLIQIAKARDQSVSSLLRQFVRARLRA